MTDICCEPSAVWRIRTTHDAQFGLRTGQRTTRSMMTVFRYTCGSACTQECTQGQVKAKIEDTLYHARVVLNYIFLECFNRISKQRFRNLLPIK